MNKLIFILLLCLLVHTGHTTVYYVSNTGNDGNNGTTTSTPWQTISKVNATTFSTGDQILFKRGDTFVGGIITKNNGVTYDAYGSGNKPVITSLVNVTDWTNLGSNIWESTNSVSSLTALNIVLINGINTPAGQTPGFYTYQSHSGLTQITSSSLNSTTTNWTGANVFIRLNDFEQVKCKITAHSGGTLTTDNTNANTPTDGYGFFITDDPRTLDVQNEWYYNPSTGKIRVYSTTQPANVQVPTQTSLFYCTNSNITVQNLNFVGASNNVIDFESCPSANIKDNLVSYGGVDGIYLDWTDNGLINGNTVSNCNDVGIKAGGSNATVSNNTIDSVGVLWNPNGCGIIISSDYHAVQYNSITNVGRYGIQDAWGYGIVQYNYINTFCINANDAGGIYTNGTRSGGTRVIDHNIVLNGVGNLNGSGDPTMAIHGIYLDAKATKVVVTYNTVANVPNGGIKMHMASACRVENNVLYNNGRNLSIEDYEGDNLRNDTLRYNLNYANSGQLNIYWWTATNDISSFGIVSNNIYVKPSNTSQLIQTREASTSYVYRNLSNWQSYREPTAATISGWNDDSKMYLAYNNTSSTTDVSLPAVYSDKDGGSHSGSISLTQYQGVLLYKTANLAAAPTLSISGNQNITASSTTIFATPVWASGHSGTVLWTKISGPGTTIIGSPASLSTLVSGLQNGDYVFRCTATQDDGQVVTVDVAVHVAISVEQNTYIQFRIPYKFNNL